MSNLPISICILSWKSGKTLANTLQSYRKNGLLSLSDDICILYQEVSENDKKLAKKFGIDFIGLKENIGIGKGIVQLFEKAKYNKVLFLEHDWELIENETVAEKRLSEGLQPLSEGFDIVRYRSRKNPGLPLYSMVHKGNELDYYDDWHQCTSPHLLESLHWLNPAEEFPDKIQKKGDYFITTSRWANWTNNPFLIDKEFYFKNIIPFLGEGVQLEKNIATWWVQQDFKIAQGEGLFKHNDLKKHKKTTIFEYYLEKIKKKLNIKQNLNT
jgi:hypothetical protein